MNGVDTQLRQFLGNVGRRVRVIVMINSLTTSLWWSAGLLLSGGLVHKLIHALNVQIMLFLALLPPLLTLGWSAITHRPGLDKCAMEADRLFNGQALMTSAWDLLHTRPPRSAGTAPLVMQRALDAAPRWQREIPVRLPIPPLGKAGLALCIAVIGVFLLSLPGQSRTDRPFLPVNHDNRSTKAPSIMILPDLTESLTRQNESIMESPASDRKTAARPNLRGDDPTAAPLGTLPHGVAPIAGDEGETHAIPDSRAQEPAIPNPEHEFVDGSSDSAGKKPASRAAGSKAPGEARSAGSATPLTVAAEPIMLDTGMEGRGSPLARKGIPLQPGEEPQDGRLEETTAFTAINLEGITKKDLNLYSPAQRAHIEHYFKKIRTFDETSR